MSKMARVSYGDFLLLRLDPDNNNLVQFRTVVNFMSDRYLAGDQSKEI